MCFVNYKVYHIPRIVRKLRRAREAGLGLAGGDGAEVVERG